MIYGCKDDQLKELMRPPEKSEDFGAGAWVYSEMAARVMVADAYAAGEKSVQQRQPPDE